MRETDSKEFQQKVLSAAQAYGKDAVDQALKVLTALQSITNAKLSKHWF